jgi:hypothetical protein
MSEALNWDRRRLRKARDALLDAEAIELVHRGGRCKGDASVYRFTDVLVPTR